MANDYRASITRLRDRLEESDEISDADAEALARYSQELAAIGHRLDRPLARQVALHQCSPGLTGAVGKSSTPIGDGRIDTPE